MDEAPVTGASRLFQPPGLDSVVEQQAQWQLTLDALRESENRFRTLADCAPVVVWMTDTDCRCTYISKYWKQFTGRDPEQDLAYRWVEALHPDDRERAASDLMEAARTVQPCRGEYRVKGANGEYGWLFDFGVPMFRVDGSYSGHVGTCMDITEHKSRESAGHRLQSSLLLGQEAERKRLSRELHDDIGQRLAMLAMSLNEMKVSQPSSILEQQLHSVRRVVDGLAEDIRRLSHNLHPATIAHLGLVASLKQLCREFSEQMRIPIEYAADRLSVSMPEDVAVALFRIGQECLANIAKHSKSSDARVSLVEESGVIRLTIADRGVGFDVQVIQANAGLGLVSIRERARMIGASLDIRSAPSRGTTVDLRVPTSAIGA